VAFSAQSSALALAQAKHNEPEEQEKRNLEANILEEKLKIIQDTVPTRVYNTCSSSAGAGSSDFHMYRQIRKTEQDRWKRVEAAHKHMEELKTFDVKRKEREEEAEAKTAKNRAKRHRKKQKSKIAKAAGGAGGAESGSDEDEDAEPSRKMGAAPLQPDLD